MRVTQSCAECLYDRQRQITDNPEYLKEIQDIIRNRGENDTSPYLVYRFRRVYERYFGRQSAYGDIKKKYNELVLGLEASIRKRIEESANPLAKAVAYARAGNYIDFGAMNQVDEGTFFELLEKAQWKEEEEKVLISFVQQCQRGRKFLLIADNCGEIVLDKLLLEQLGKYFPHLELSVLVRGGEVLNDATMEDAEQVGLSQVAKVYSNGLPIAGTVYELLSEEGRRVMDESDVILAKGQGNYESLSRQGRHIFYCFLCKCDLFTSTFQVPRLTGIFMEEDADGTRIR